MGVEARRRHQRVRRDSVTASRSGLRGVDSEEAIRWAIALAREYGAWGVELAKPEYGIDAQAESGQGLSTSIEELLVPRGRLYLVEREGLPVALGGLKPISDEIAEIKRMYVRPSARGHGLGRQLLEQLLADARALDFRLVRLEKRRLHARGARSLPKRRIHGHPTLRRPRVRRHSRRRGDPSLHGASAPGAHKAKVKLSWASVRECHPVQPAV